MARGRLGWQVDDRSSQLIFDINEIKAIPISQIATALGFQLNGRSARCRLPDHEDKTSSFSILPDKNLFRCFACNRRGDGISLVAIMRDTDFVGACRWLIDRFGVRQTYNRGAPVQPISAKSLNRAAPTQLSKVTEQKYHRDVEIFSWLLQQSPLTSSGFAYLTSRSFSAATIDHFKVGQIGDDRRILQELRRAFGDDRLGKCGLMSEGKRGPYLVFPTGYLVFPFFEANEITFLQARRSDDGRTRRWLCPAHLRPPAFNLNALQRGATTVYICEGVTDVMSARQLEIPAIGLIGASSHIDSVTIDMLRGRNVAVVGDGDQAGSMFVQRLVKLLGDYGITVMRKSIPPGCKDLNDVLRVKQGGGL